MKRIAILGTAHPHAFGFWNAFTKYPQEAELLGYADVPPWDDQDPEEKARTNLGEDAVRTVKRFDDYRALLDRKPDLVLVSTDNRVHGELVRETLSRGIPTVVEKPMAMDFTDAAAMAEMARETGTFLAVNWPIAWCNAFGKAKELIDQGRIGRVMRVVYRSPATWGPYSYSGGGKLPPENFLRKTWWYRKDRGGGALLDYACYGAAVSTWYFGRRAERVLGLTKNFTLPGFDLEDYAAMILDFGGGVGLLEGSWSSYNCGEIPSGPVVYGTEGTLVCDRRSSLVKVYTGRSHLAVAPAQVIDCGGTSSAALARNVLDSLEDRRKLHPLLEPERNLDVMAALEAGRLSAQTGKAVETAGFQGIKG